VPVGQLQGAQAGSGGEQLVLPPSVRLGHGPHHLTLTDDQVLQAWAGSRLYSQLIGSIATPSNQ
jgi:hypothetical protein